MQAFQDTDNLHSGTHLQDNTKRGDRKNKGLVVLTNIKSQLYTKVV